MSKPTDPVFCVALNNIRSLYNVGSIFRTADAFGVDEIILGGYTGSPPRKEISKTALGAETWVPFTSRFNVARALKNLKQQGFLCVGLENNRNHTRALTEFHPTFPLVLVLGNEVRGITPAVAKVLDLMVHIPMAGAKESLNVSVAFGIAAYAISQARISKTFNFGL